MPILHIPLYHTFEASHFSAFGGGHLEAKYGNMGREDQVEEREVLASIFPDEITGMIESRLDQCKSNFAQISTKRISASR
jgi:hypothetical protein